MFVSEHEACNSAYLEHAFRAEPGSHRGNLPTTEGGPPLNARSRRHNKPVAGRGSKQQVSKSRKMKRLFPDDEEVPYPTIAHFQAVLLTRLHDAHNAKCTSGVSS